MNLSEEQIKNELLSRIIMPTNSAWSRLESRLDKTRTKPPYIYWTGIAASFLLGIVVSGLYFSHFSSKKEFAQVKTPVAEPMKKGNTIMASIAKNNTIKQAKIEKNNALPSAKPKRKSNIALHQPENNQSIKKLINPNKIASVSNIEIEQMLKKARQRIKSNALAGKQENQVEAIALLNSVEQNIQSKNRKTFKTQAMEFAQNKFKEVKGLLALK